MSTRSAYRRWSAHYDSTPNKTRDLEAHAQRELLGGREFDRVLEWGCGTGKNTIWLAEHSKSVVALDFSEEMLDRAKQKVTAPHVKFQQADLNADWPDLAAPFDLISFSLVLEHIQNLESVFVQAAQHLNLGGTIYVGEFHPFKQYLGSKAGIEIDSEQITPNCYTHHLSDYLRAAENNGFELIYLNEYFDESLSPSIPRILGMLFEQNI